VKDHAAGAGWRRVDLEPQEEGFVCARGSLSEQKRPVASVDHLEKGKVAPGELEGEPPDEEADVGRDDGGVFGGNGQEPFLMQDCGIPHCGKPPTFC
jgi:hypothetical protein